MTQSIGNNVTYEVIVPSLVDNADIVDALKIYHYGSTVVPTTTGGLVGGIATYLYNIQNDVNGKVPKSVASAKGDILVATANDQFEVLSRVTTGGLEYVLAIDDDALNSKGVKWVTSSKEEERIAHIMGVF